MMCLTLNNMDFIKVRISTPYSILNIVTYTYDNINKNQFTPIFF